MKIVVAGTGKVGRTIIEYAIKENHEITVIDKSAKVIEQLVNQYDVIGMVGNASNIEILKDIRVDKSDLFIATTSSDEINVLSCFIAKQLGATSTVARIRDYDYSNQTRLISNSLGINLVINPEQETANEIYNLINLPEAITVEKFAKGNLELIELVIPENNLLVGMSLSSIFAKYQTKVLVCAIQRGEEVIIPDGNFVIEAKDKIHITATKLNIKNFLNKFGFIETKIKENLIIGGGKISLYLAKILLKNKLGVKIIEKDYDRCLEMTELLPDATIIHGDGSEQDLLLDEGIANKDAVIALTGSDEENIVISLFALKQNAKKLITKINKHTFVGLIDALDMTSVVSPQRITAQKIISYIRAKSNSRGSNVKTLYKLVNGEIEALEFIAKDNKKINGKTLIDLKLKKNILIAAIIRENEVIIPKGIDTIQENDSVIVISKDHILDDLSDILE